MSVVGAAPAGAAIASATDMARYLITQLNGGMAPDGTRVVSSANLAQTHRPGIAVPPDATNALPAVVLPHTIAMHYCLGWFDRTFKDGRHLIWHGGAIDGFGSRWPAAASPPTRSGPRPAAGPQDGRPAWPWRTARQAR